MSNELYHYGIKGQQWGRRLYQNKDGSLTAAGKKRYGSSTDDLGDTQHLGNRISYDGKKLVGVTTSQRVNPLPKGTHGWRRINRDEYVVEDESLPNSERYTFKNVESNGKKFDNDVSYTGRSMNVSGATGEKIVNNQYDDLSDDELDTLYELTGDEEIVKYRKRRTASVVAAGKAYTNGSTLDNLIETASAMVTNSKTAALVRKGKLAAKRMVGNIHFWLGSL